MRKINLIKPIGYCLGVVQAIEKSIKIKQAHLNQRVFIYGLLVHNEEVIKYLNDQNLITINDYEVEFDQFISLLRKEDIVIFSAHGHKEEYEKKLKQKEIKFYDTTCVNVSKNIELIKQYSNRGVIYIGKKNHKETLASLSVSPNVILYDVVEGLDFKLVKYDSPVVINQTTLSFIEIEDIHREIITQIPNALLLDEVCSATRIRQEKIKDIDDQCDLIIVIGSNKSSNTQKLYDIAKSIHSNKMVIKIQNKEELLLYNFIDKINICILSGTSTPLSIINEVKYFLEEYDEKGI